MCPDCLTRYNNLMNEIKELNDELGWRWETMKRRARMAGRFDDPSVMGGRKELASMAKKLRELLEIAEKTYGAKDEIIGFNQVLDPETGEWVEGTIPYLRCGVCGKEFWGI